MDPSLSEKSVPCPLGNIHCMVCLIHFIGIPPDHSDTLLGVIVRKKSKLIYTNNLPANGVPTCMTTTTECHSCDDSDDIKEDEEKITVNVKLTFNGETRLPDSAPKVPVSHSHDPDSVVSSQSDSIMSSEELETDSECSCGQVDCLSSDDSAISTDESRSSELAPSALSEIGVMSEKSHSLPLSVSDAGMESCEADISDRISAIESEGNGNSTVKSQNQELNDGARPSNIRPSTCTCTCSCTTEDKVASKVYHLRSSDIQHVGVDKMMLDTVTSQGNATYTSTCTSKEVCVGKSKNAEDQVTNTVCDSVHTVHCSVYNVHTSNMVKVTTPHINNYVTTCVCSCLSVICDHIHVLM